MRYYIGNQPKASDRRQIDVGEYDAARIDAATAHREPFQITVFDRIADKAVTIADEDCGLGCRCALRVVECAKEPIGKKTFHAKKGDVVEILRKEKLFWINVNGQCVFRLTTEDHLPPIRS